MCVELLRESFYNDYQLLDHIGSGAFGRAMKAQRRTDLEMVVVKEVLIGRMSEKEKAEVSICALGGYCAFASFSSFNLGMVPADKE